ncbi:MAG: ATP-binding protein [Eubacteriales bacterium]|jgi:two-component system phosphate regulon sensor histidine kinase PhoR
MKRAIFGRFLAVLLTGLLLCGAVTAGLLSRVILQETQQNMLYALRLVEYALDPEEDLQKQLDTLNPLTLTEDTRLTLVDDTGHVLADTGVDSDLMENHADREEIRQAMETGVGMATRHSETLHSSLLYVAAKSETSDYIIRLAVPYRGMWDYLPILLPAILCGILAAVVVSLILSERFAGSIARPMVQISGELLRSQDGDQPLQLPRYQYEEVNIIARAAENLTGRVERTMNKLREERRRIDTILDNMSEGMILLDRDQRVLTVNQSAGRILGCQGRAAGEDLAMYTQCADILHGVDAALQEGRESRFDLEADGRIYAVYVSPIREDQLTPQESGVILLLVDATSNRRAQQMRQEFFSNASHELKTPLTSIQGFVELLRSGMAEDEATRKEFLDRIHRETRNMAGLVEDILTISRLEARMTEEKPVDVPLREVVAEVSASLAPLAEREGVRLRIQCPSLVVGSTRQQMQQLVSNLLSNAIKYNKRGGEASLTAEARAGQLYLRVEDTGIGIPLDCQQRVFERFFRVDKGRSRKQGGTGLGLSIVKHIVQFYGGRVELKSQPGQGTQVTVIMPILRQSQSEEQAQ